MVDKVSTKEEAILEIYKRMKPSEPPNLEVAENYFKGLFFDADKYDLGEVGRLKMNHRFNTSFDDIPITCGVLTKKM